MVTIISDTIQEYEGTRYYLCGRYFQKQGSRLHRKVWIDANGPVPEGMHVHHVDHDRHNNALENLALIPASEHVGSHMKAAHAAGKSSLGDKAREAAAKWAGTEESRALKRKVYAEKVKHIWESTVDAVCQHCGSVYKANKIRHDEGRAKYCGNSCRTKARRQRFKKAMT